MLREVINPLRTKGFLNATRGAKGGYVLARPPDAINMLDVLTTLEGPVSILKCLTDEKSCPRVHTCVARSVWMDVNQAIEKSLAGITLANMLNKPPYRPRP